MPAWLLLPKSPYPFDRIVMMTFSHLIVRAGMMALALGCSTAVPPPNLPAPEFEPPRPIEEPKPEPGVDDAALDAPDVLLPQTTQPQTEQEPSPP